MDSPHEVLHLTSWSCSTQVAHAAWYYEDSESEFLILQPCSRIVREFYQIGWQAPGCPVDAPPIVSQRLNKNLTHGTKHTHTGLTIICEPLWACGVYDQKERQAGGDLCGPSARPLLLKIITQALVYPLSLPLTIMFEGPVLFISFVFLLHALEFRPFFLFFGMGTFFLGIFLFVFFLVFCIVGGSTLKPPWDLNLPFTKGP